MSTRRFKDELVSGSSCKHPSTTLSAERIPLVHLEHGIPPPPPPLPTSINEKQFTSKKPFNAFRRATVAAAIASLGQPMKKTQSASIIHGNNSDNVYNDDSDVDSNNQSNSNDTLPSRTTNKFLEELRLKRQELKAKAKNLTIDQRIAFHRLYQPTRIRRAQDLFDVHFECDDIEENLPTTEFRTFTEESQEKIRGDIFKELDRQRSKQFYKYHRHLLFGRTLLIMITLLLIFMSLILIYVVIDLYDRAKFLNSKLSDNEFIPIMSDKLTNLT